MNTKKGRLALHCLLAAVLLLTWSVTPGCGTSGGVEAVPTITTHTYSDTTSRLTVTVSHPNTAETLVVKVTEPTGMSVDSTSKTISKAKTVSAKTGTAVFLWTADDPSTEISGMTTITVTDSRGKSASVSHNITIKVQNHEPVINSHTSEQLANGDVRLVVEVDDADHDGLTVAVSDVAGFTLNGSSVMLDHPYAVAQFVFTRDDNTAAVSGDTTITVTDVNSGTDDVSHTIAYDPVWETVAGINIDPDPTATDNIYAPYSGTLDASVSVEHIISAVTQYDWDLNGDGTFEIEDGDATQAVEWTQPDTYTVNVRTIGEHETDTHQRVFEVHNPISWSANPVAGKGSIDVTFTLDLTNLATTPARYEWDFNGDGTTDLTNEPPVAGDEVQTFTLENDTENQITLIPTVIVTDEDGNFFTLPDFDDPASPADVEIVISSADAPDVVFDGTLGSGPVPAEGSGSTEDPYIVDIHTDYSFALVHVADGDVTNSADTVWIVTPAEAGTWTDEELNITDSYEGAFNVSASYKETLSAADTTVYFTAPVNELPDAVLDATPTLGENVLTVVYDASSSSDTDGTIVDYEWDFDGNGVYNEGEVTNLNSEAAAQGDDSPQHNYTEYGIYHATVRVTDDRDGQTVGMVEWQHPLDSSTVNDVVLNQLPDPVLYATPDEGIPTLAVFFDARPSSDVEPPVGSITKFEFNFDEGAGWEDYGLTATANNNFETPGTYNVQVRVTDNWGATSTKAVPVLVNAPPVADLTTAGPATGYYDNFTVSFDASGSYDPDQSIRDTDGIWWDFDGDGVYNEAGAEADAADDDTPEFTYGREHIHVQNGTDIPFNAAVKVFDEYGVSDVATVAIEVRGYPPHSIWEMDYDPDGNNPEFDAEHLDEPDGEPNFKVRIGFTPCNDDDDPVTGEIMEIFVDWGDGTTNTYNPNSAGFTGIEEHEYTEGSLPLDNPLIDTWDRTVTVTVTDNDGLKDTSNTPDNNPGGDYPVEVHGWRRCLVDSGNGGSIDVGQWSSMQLVDGNPAIAYYDTTNHRLMYVRANTPIPYRSSDWGTPVVVHEDDNYGDATPVDVGQYCQLLQVGIDDRPAIAYYDAVNNGVYYLRAEDASGNTWDSTNAKQVVSPGNVEGYISFAIIDGRPAITFIEDGDVMFIRADDSDGNNWMGGSVMVDSANGIEGHEYTALASVGGFPAVAYRDVDSNDLTYRRASNSTGSTWGAYIDIDTSVNVVQSIQLRMIDGRPALVYHHRIDNNNRNIEYVRANDSTGSTWAASIVLGQGKFPAMAQAELANSYPWVSYCEFNGTAETGHLKAKHADNSTGHLVNNWNDYPAKDADPVPIDRGEYTSVIMLEVEEDVWRPAISYYDAENGQLRFCIYN